MPPSHADKRFLVFVLLRAALVLPPSQAGAAFCSARAHGATPTRRATRQARSNTANAATQQTRSNAANAQQRSNATNAEQRSNATNAANAQQRSNTANTANASHPRDFFETAGGPPPHGRPKHCAWTKSTKAQNHKAQQNSSTTLTFVSQGIPLVVPPLRPPLTLGASVVVGQLQLQR